MRDMNDHPHASPARPAPARSVDPRSPPAGDETQTPQPETSTCRCTPRCGGTGRAPAEVRDGAGAGVAGRVHPGRVRLPHAPADRAGGSRELPHLRHGARAAHGLARRGEQPGAPGDDPALLGERRAQRAGRRPGDGGVARASVGLGPARAVGAGRPLGRLALLPAGLGVGGEPQPQHVHPHRAGDGRGLRLQRGSGLLPRRPAGDHPRPRWSRAGLLRGSRGDHHAGAPRPGPRAPRTERHLGAIRALLRLAPRTARRVRRTASTRTSRWSRWRGATDCASGPGRPSRSTASCWRARAPSTSRWSPASPCRWRRRWAAG